MKQTYYLYILLIITIMGCNQKSKQNRMDSGLKQGVVNSQEFSSIFKNKVSLLQSTNSEELVKIATEIYIHVGTPFSTQDTQRLYVAIELLDRALELDSLNRSAYKTKINVLTIMQQWDKSLIAIENWLQKGEVHYYDYMLKGFIYEIINLMDSSRISFEAALNLFNKSSYTDDDVRNQVQKAIILSFIYGQEEGLKTINKIIDKTNDKYAQLIKESVIQNFDKKKYIEEHVFIKPEELTPAPARCVL